MVSVAVPAALIVTVASVVPPSLKVTVPVGADGDPAAPTTVAVNVTASPTLDGLLRMT